VRHAPSYTILTFLMASPGLSSGGIVLPSRSSAGRKVDVYEVQNEPCETCAAGAATNVRCSLRHEKKTASRMGQQQVVERMHMSNGGGRRTTPCSAPVQAPWPAGRSRRRSIRGCPCTAPSQPARAARASTHARPCRRSLTVSSSTQRRPTTRLRVAGLATGLAAGVRGLSGGQA
jgi:hypothetical protein